MFYQPADLQDTGERLPTLPRWVTPATATAPETVTLQMGASLAVLDAILRDHAKTAPVALLAKRLALMAAISTSKIEGRRADEAAIRDAFYLAQASEALGPDGALFAFWRSATALSLTRGDWTARLSALHGDVDEDTIDSYLQMVKAQGLIAAVTGILETVLTADDRAERVALLLSDVILAKSLGWRTPLPLTAMTLSKADLRAIKTGEGGRIVPCALLKAVGTAIRLAHHLAHHAVALQGIAAKLRSKASDAAVELFLTEDAVAPSTMLSPVVQGTRVPMSPRAARRFCDRLIELGVAKELTGRDTFRLYGIGP